jgi:hypothetical protein
MKLWSFGDSFSCALTSDHKWAKLYTDFKGYVPKIYSELIADELGLELRNFAKSGDSNYGIFHEFVKKADKINSGDMVIIQFSSVYRFRLVNKDDKFESISAYWKDQYNKFNESEKTIQEIGINRTSKEYLEEIEDWIKIINISLPLNKIFFWSPFEESTGNKNMLPYYDLPDITKETNSMVNDHHYGEIGHNQIANIILTKIINKKSII